ncbi:hypothetical protein FACS1894171_2060 [Clostridia bacterium]|nr:hypothetical protein FACS1894171_2060 [Clostridia bacterium]
MKSFRILAIVFLLSFAVSVSASAVSVTDFSDVKPSDWYYGAVDYAASNGLFNGTSSTTFSPNTFMTRGMFVTVLGRIAGVPDTYGRAQSTPFSDVTQADYFFPYAVWANDNGIAGGVGNNSFNPNAEISREQMAAMLFRYAGKFGYDITYSAERYNAFTDTASVSGYAVNAVQWATAHGIINGADGKLSPRDDASRAQVAQIFLNFSQLEATEPDEPSKPIEPEEPADWENYNPEYFYPTGKSAADADGGYYDYDLASEIAKQVNALRVKNGLDALLYHPKIQEWAFVRAREQTIREGHTRPDGTIFGSAGSGLTSENITILLGCTESKRNNISDLAARAVNNWYTSTNGHKEAMLSSASHLGAIACYIKGDTVYIVHLFSNRTLYYMDYLI